jgi:TRAP-type mannitol/chloroaromatic compound transport system permease large subunit
VDSQEVVEAAVVTNGDSFWGPMRTGLINFVMMKKIYIWPELIGDQGWLNI